MADITVAKEQTETPNPQQEPLVRKGESLVQQREDDKSKLAEKIAEISHQYPGVDLASKGEWWIPAVNFNFDVKGCLPLPTQEKLNSCLQRIIDQKYAPETVGPALNEARGYLAGDEELLKRFEGLFGNRGFWDKMYKRGVEKGDSDIGKEGENACPL